MDADAEAGQWEGLAEQVAVLRNSLFETVFRDGWRRAGLFELTNRTLLGLPFSVIPVLFRRSRSSRFHYLDFYRTLFDQRLSKVFLDAFSDHLEPRNILKARSQKHLLQIFDSNYWLMPWRIDMASEHDIGMTCHPLDVDGTEERAAYLMLRELYAASEANPSWRLISEALGTNVIKIESGSRRSLCSDELMRTDAPDYKRRKPVVEAALDEMAVVLGENVYDRFAQSPLLSHGAGGRASASAAPNILLFWKVFDRSALRCGSYAYDTRCIIPPRQREDLIEALWRRRDGIAALPSPDAGRERDLFDADQRVRSSLQRREHVGSIVDALASPQPDNERLFCEHTLNSGLYSLRRRPLGLRRQASLDARMPRDPRAFWRMMCFRAVISCMLPEHVDVDQTSVIMMPLRVGGAPAGCIAAFRQHSILEAPLLDEQSFFYTFHYYHAIVEHALRSVRTKSRDAYLRLVAAQLVEELARAARLAADGKRFSPQSFNDEVSRNAAMLARVFPYMRIVFSSVPNRLLYERKKALQLKYGRGLLAARNEALPGRKESRVVRIYDEWANYSSVTLADNPVFDRTGDDSFLKEEQVTAALQAAVLELERSTEYIDLVGR